MKMCNGKTVILTTLMKKLFEDGILAVYHRNDATWRVIMRKPIVYIHGGLARKVRRKLFDHLICSLIQYN